MSARRRVLLRAATGLGLAAVVLTAAPSTAATDETWDALAWCESSGNWSIDTGNGYYGGLQFSAATWAGYGGHAYARQANLASRDQQIAIGERVLGSQGWGAWPSCSSRLGLTDDDITGTPTDPGAEAATGTYVVRAGDTFYSIAARHGTDVSGLLRMNPSVADPALIYVGQALVVPAG